MANLEINQRFKNAEIPYQNEEFCSDIKKFFAEIIKYEPFVLDKLSDIKKSFLLNEEYFDFLLNTDNLEFLTEKGYEETTADNFHQEPYNSCVIRKVNEIKNHKTFSKTISYGGNDTLHFEKKENTIYVFKNKKVLLLEIKCVNGILIDFGFDEQNFLYILYKDEDSYGLIKTHKAYNFFSEHNKSLSILDLLNCESFYNIKNIIFKDFDLLDSILMYDKENNIYVFKNNKILLLKQIKKYYCLNNGKYYYNSTLLENNFDISAKQIKHLFIYELVKLYGIEQYPVQYKYPQDEPVSNISSYENEKVKKLFGLKFDNTLNGILNTYAFNIMNTSNNEEKAKPVNVDDGKVICRGWFKKDLTEYYNEKYEIRIEILESVYEKTDRIKLKAELLSEWYNGPEVIFSEIFYTTLSLDGLLRSFIFCNLEFIFYNYTYVKGEEIKIKIKDIDNQINFVKSKTCIKNEIIPGVKNINYKVHNQKGFVLNKQNEKGNLNFKLEGDNIVFESTRVETALKIGSKLNQDNFKIPITINNKLTNTFKNLEKDSYYVEYENLISFDSSEIKDKIKDNKEIVIIVEENNG